jgi:hypothetical protein
MKCPCKRWTCVRHGDCDACRLHHRLNKKNPPWCERARRVQKVEKVDARAK